MSSTKLNPTRALKVIPSDNCDIPTPYVLIQGTATSAGGNTLTDSSVLFYKNNTSGNREYAVNVGDVVYNLTANSAATIISIDTNKTLTINAAIMTVGDVYVIYQSSQSTGLGNQGCLLYVAEVGIGKVLELITIGRDTMTINDVMYGLIPIQAEKVTTNTTINNLYALW